MDALLNRRNLALERLKRENASVISLKERQAPAFEIEDRLRKLHELEENFERIQTEIEESSDPEDLPSVLNFRTDFETLFYATKGLFNSLLTDAVGQSEPAVSSWRSCGSNNSDATYEDPGNQLKEAVRALLETQQTLLRRQVAASTSVSELAVQLQGRQAEPVDTQLPSYTLPIFKGDRKQWLSFKDLFTSNVDQKNLTNALKLQLLLSHLDGEAKSLVSTYAITDANYKEVWDTLVEHYDKPKFAVSALVQEFCEQPTIKVANLSNLRKLVSTSDEVIRQLKAMGPEYETRDPWLIHQILKKLDDSLRSQWAQHIVDVDNPTFADILKFLKRKCDAFETCAAFGGKFNEVKREPLKDDRKYTPIKKEIRSLSVVQDQVCPMCSGNHVIYQCNEFKQASVQERRDVALSARLCFNCLRANHCVRFCSSKSVCHTPECKQRHHTLLCQSTNAQTSNINSDPAESQPTQAHQPDDEPTTDSQVVSCSASVKTNCFSFAVSMLPTAIVQVKGRNNQFCKVRAMIDSGSQASLITEHCVTRLGLQRKNANLVVTGISDCASGETRGVVMLEISSRFDCNPVIRTQAYVLAKLARNLPEQQIDVSSLRCLESLQLADPGFDRPGEIDLILGADVFLSILAEGKVHNENGFPVAVNSVFGWIVAGRIGAATTLRSYPAIVNLHTELDVDRLLRQFWEFESISKPLPLTQDEQKAVDYFRSTYQRDRSGRFEVRLPFDDSKPALGESLTAATQRLKAMERKFKANPEFEEQYRRFMLEYLELGHMEPVSAEEINIPVNDRFYLPHHAVLKNDSFTTKLRVVFDGSSKSTTGVSLNDKLLVGPNINEDLSVVLTRFRTYAVAFTADAEKMYRQVKVHKCDTDFLRIVFRDRPDLPIEHYRLLTVTYGTSCAAYLAIESLRQAARDCEAMYPIAADRIVKNFYVDDLLSGAATLEEAIKLRSEIMEITSSAGFNLRKWSTNTPQLLDDDIEASQTSVPLQLSTEADPVKALGITWLPQLDAFAFQVNLDTTKSNTKRQLLSDSARLFDPEGWIAPVTVRIKILFQTLWLCDLQWDDPLPAVVNNEWIKIKESLHLIEKIKIPRWISNYGGRVELHGFADASESAYAAVVYARSFDDEGMIHVSLVASKTKVAPIQQISLPRLELNAAVLLTELLKRIMESMTHLEVTCFAWTDSTIVLEWLSAHPRKWKTFVANRTSMILDVLPRSSWNHVSTSDNPADCASRGILPIELLDHPLWWTGPPWLHENVESWNEQPISTVADDQRLEQRKTQTCLIVRAFNQESVRTYDVERSILDRYSSLIVAQRVLAWINRFINNISVKRLGSKKAFGTLTPSEIQEADLQLAQCAQDDHFKREIVNLQKGLEVPMNSNLKSLYPFLDGAGTLRVGGRLQNSDQPYHKQHPIILPKFHRYTRQLIHSVHLQNFHAGPTLLMATVSQRFWILGCQAVVRSVINSCTQCVRWKAQSAKQLMGSLPAVRTTGGRVFENVGVDYAGPINIRTSTLRTAKTVKGYIAVFICLSTKAIHIEAVTDLSSNAFISALKRFCGRRGLPSQLWSDNGTNFVGADRQLKELLQSAQFGSAVDHYLSNLGIKWTFITPAAPHMGGIWEAAVKSMKRHLRVVIGTVTLTYEDLATVLIQVEACLNSRPLCALSSSIDSYEALTPGHFIIGQPLNMVLEPDVSHVPENRLDRYQRLRRYVGEIWSRWSGEYLSTLQPRNKWQSTTNNVKVGELVLVKTDNTPPAYWELARVVEVHPDRNGIVRNVTLRKGITEYQRPIHKLVVLPSD